MNITAKFKFLILFCLLYISIEFYHTRNLDGIKLSVLYMITMTFPVISSVLLLERKECMQYFTFIYDALSLIGILMVLYSLFVNCAFVLNGLDYEIFYVDNFLMRYQVVEIFNIQYKQRIILTEMARYASIFKNPNTYGHLLAISSMWTIHQCFTNQEHKNHFLLLKLLLLTYGIYLSGSKNSMLFLLVFYLVYLFFNVYKHYRLKKSFKFLVKSLILCKML